ncbi:protein kinase domain-containing protein [Nocardioides insulae]|uniref:protein kinase domain-containing protein n=1 Tax=Nocardioides insulae TaxID=394734 RepID=UPI00041728B2|nr:protein kinase [Nocardioides insulae]
MSAHLVAGQLLGDYRIERAIAVGAMGAVFAATDLRLGRPVAVKVLRGHLGSSDRFRERFRREAAVLARLDSPHVIAIYDHGELDGSPYLVTQLAAGGDLGSLVRRGGPLPPGTAVEVAAQVADALVATHSVGVVHRDVKPANVLLRTPPVQGHLVRPHVYLCDFGVARTESSGLTTAGSITGTWNYLAPELGRGESATPASDVYAVGCLLHEALTGRPPYSGSDVEVAMAHLDRPVPQLPGQDPLTEGLNRALARSMAKSPEHRHASAAELRADLRALLGGPRDTGTIPGPPATTGQVPRGRRRVPWIAGAAAVVVLAGGLVAWRFLGDGAGGDPSPAGTTPTQPGTSAAVARAVAGDVTGDGLGDVVVTVDSDHVRVFPSTGAGFGEADDRPDVSATLTGDVDGDQRLDLIDISGDNAEIDADMLTADGWSRAFLRGPDGTERADGSFSADVDGNGLDDLAMITESGGSVHVTGILARPDGSWSESAEWLTLSPGDETVRMLAADLDGDGSDEIVRVQRTAENTTALRVWRFDGTTLAPLGDGARVPLPQGAYSHDASTAGDLDGDGVDEVVIIAGTHATALHWSDAGWETTGLTASIGEDGYVDGAGVSDVDGDDRDDLMILTRLEEGYRIDAWRSTGDAVEADDAYRVSLPRVSSSRLLGPTDSGFYS